MSLLVEMPCLHRRLLEIAIKMSGNPIDQNNGGEEGRYPSFGVPLHKSPAVIAALCDIGKEKQAKMHSTSGLKQEKTDLNHCKTYNCSVGQEVSTNTEILPSCSKNLSKKSHEHQSSRFHPYRKAGNIVPVYHNFKEEKPCRIPSNPSWTGSNGVGIYSDNIKKSFSAPGQLHTKEKNIDSSSIYDQMYAFSVRNLAQSCSKHQAPANQHLPTSTTMSNTVSGVPTTTMTTNSMLPSTTSSAQVQQNDNFRRLMLSLGNVKASLTDFELLRQRHIAYSLATRGLCVVEGFVGAEISSKIREEAINLHREKNCVKGALIGAKHGNSAVRGDVITWIDGTEPYCENIGILCRTMDRIVAMGTGIAPEYNICGGTKLMVAKYPGKGTGYRRHVDNPAKDGRCITCTYFCNKDWNIKENGGALQVYSARGSSTQITPELDTVAIFYSDSRTPHEVLPCFKDRYAITLWYFDREERANALKLIDRKRNVELMRKSSPSTGLNASIK
ncbi:uncharacterized protein LOC120334439 [Styela clava]